MEYKNSHNATEQSNTPRVGQRVTTPDGPGTYLGASDLYAPGLIPEGTWATILTDSGKRLVYELDAVRAAS